MPKKWRRGRKKNRSLSKPVKGWIKQSLSGAGRVRFAKHLGMKTTEFKEIYSQADEDSNLCLKKLPCPFLDKENCCTIYKVRPQDCAEYQIANDVLVRKLYSRPNSSSELDSEKGRAGLFSELHFKISFQHNIAMILSGNCHHISE